MKRATVRQTRTVTIVETFVVDHDEAEPDWSALRPEGHPVEVDKSAHVDDYVLVEEEDLYVVTMETPDGQMWLTYAKVWTYDPTYRGVWPKITAEHHAAMWRASDTPAVAVVS